MPVGSGAVLTRNLPSQKFDINPALFDQLTKPADQPVNTVAFPGFGSGTKLQIFQEGVLSEFNLVFQGAVTTAGTVSIAATWRWPYGLIGLYQLSGNGQVNFFSCNGYDLYIRALLSNRAYVDGMTVSAFDGSSAGTTQVQIVWHVPVAMDPTTNVGALYAQSESTNLTYYIQCANLSDLFTVTTGTLTMTGNFYVQETLFDIPYDPSHPDTLVIPDLSVLHGFQANDFAVAGSFQPVANLFRANAQLERLIFYVENGTSLMVPQTNGATTGIAQAQIIYGVSTNPYNYNPITQLLFKQNRNYRNALPTGVFVWDAVADNPARDSILLEGTPNIRLQLTIASGTTIASSAQVHIVQETLFA